MITDASPTGTCGARRGVMSTSASHVLAFMLSPPFADLSRSLSPIPPSRNIIATHALRR